MGNKVCSNHYGDLIIGDHVLKSFDIYPNSFLDMKKMNESNKIKVNLFNIQSNTIQKNERLELEMINSVKNDVFLIVFGGWIPCSFIKRKTILLADRNIITEITSRYKKGEKKSNEDFDSFDSIFLQNTNVCIDISAFVIEGNKRKIPTNDMIDQQVDNVRKSLKLALPSLKIYTYTSDNAYYYSLRDLLEPNIKKRMAFLQEISPKLNRQFTEKSREKAVNVIFEVAKKIQLKHSDLIIILALLRITMIGEKTAAQLVLKDSQIYTEDKAYNAACDLSTIEMLINMHKYHKENKSIYSIALITKDKGLSLFSSLLNDTEFNGRDGDNLKIKTTLTTSIFDDSLLKSYRKWFRGEY